MRVNHAGEVAAQALYHGQALVARSPATRECCSRPREEEADHWPGASSGCGNWVRAPACSIPLWYLGSFAIGAVAAAFGDGASLGFVAETERQVEGHLDEHLQRLPAADPPAAPSWLRCAAMKSRMPGRARAAGAAELPGLVRELMRGAAKVMTRTAYWI